MKPTAIGEQRACEGTWCRGIYRSIGIHGTACNLSLLNIVFIGIAMHWALPALEACLPPELFAKIPTIQVDSVEGAKGQLDSYHDGEKTEKVHAHLN